ncbi:cold-shock protein [Candidatus Bathyarchaeota archaeon]|nr:cold-shock protein [Candidatus Bathyarchaeota archaeon]
MKGTVKWFSARKGYGFIAVDDQEGDIFVHYSNIVSDDEFKTLRGGDEVEFEVQEGRKGPEAINVVITKAAAPEGGKYGYGNNYGRSYNSGW